MNWFGRVWHRRRLEAELHKELEYHLQHQADDYVKAGFTEPEARRKAQLKFGGSAHVGEECRDARGTLWLESILKDLRLSFRALRKSPGFAVAAIGTLALGIGANTSIFRLLDAVRLRSLPVNNPQRLVLVQLADKTGWRGNQATPYPALTNPVWEHFRDTQHAFSGVLAWGNNDFNIANSGETRLVRRIFVSGDFFHVLGVPPLRGRVFSARDDQRGCGVPGAIISYSFWQRELAGDASVIGRKLTLNFQRVPIIGVTPATFSGLEIGRSYDLAVPICSQAVLWNAGNWLNEGTIWWLTVMGRLKEGQTPAQASAQLRATSPGLFRATLPANYPSENVKDYLKFKLQAVPASNGVSFLRDQYGDPLLLLLATTALVLMIACANLANLLLARATARTHEFAVRLAIGASRTRLVQQLMTEGLLLTAGGAAAGLLLSGVLTRFLIALLGTEGNPLFLDLEPDWRMLGFTVAIASLTCVLFSLTPAYRATRIAAGEAMKTSGRTLTVSHERFGLRQLLVVAQVSLSLVLLVSALLFSGSLRNLLAVNAGFQQNGILIANFDFARLQIPPRERIAFKRGVLEGIRAVPGISSAAQVDVLPLSGNGTNNNVWADEAGRRQVISNFNWLSDGYFRTMGMALLSGRDFTEHDTTSSPRVAIVNQTFARRLGLGIDPIGKQFRRQATPEEPETVFQIVGLVKDTKYYSLREEFAPIAFLPIAQTPDTDPFSQVMIRPSISLASTISAVKTASAKVSPLIGTDFRAFDTIVREGLMRERLMASLSSFFGVLAVLIASLGLYGVMSYVVVRRTNEIGVRIALGADSRNIVTLILREAGVLLVIGLIAGSLMALVVTRAAESMLFGLKSHDIRMLAFAALLLAAVTLAASYMPARRAARLEPLMALREG